MLDSVIDAGKTVRLVVLFPPGGVGRKFVQCLVKNYAESESNTGTQNSLCVSWGWFFKQLMVRVIQNRSVG